MRHEGRMALTEKSRSAAERGRCGRTDGESPKGGQNGGERGIEGLQGDESPAEIMEKERPCQETDEFSDEHIDATFDGREAIEAQSDGKDIAHKGQPGHQGKQGTPTVDAVALFFQCGGLDMEPLLYPRPFAQPADAKGGEATQPVAQRAGQKTGNRIATGKKDAGIEGVGGKGDDGGSKKRAK